MDCLKCGSDMVYDMDSDPEHPTLVWDNISYCMECQQFYYVHRDKHGNDVQLIMVEIKQMDLKPIPNNAGRMIGQQLEYFVPCFV